MDFYGFFLMIFPMNFGLFSYDFLMIFPMIFLILVLITYGTGNRLEFFHSTTPKTAATNLARIHNTKRWRIVDGHIQIVRGVLVRSSVGRSIGWRIAQKELK
jgi:hypothetical protein